MLGAVKRAVVSAERGKKMGWLRRNEGSGAELPIGYEASRLTPTQKARVIEKVKGKLRKVKKQEKRMTLKKERRLRKLSGCMGGFGEAGSSIDKASVESMIRNSPPVEIYDRDPYPEGFPEGSTRAIVKQVNFVPRAGSKLVDIPVDLTEQVREELVESYGVSDDDAKMLASNAVDRWVEKQVAQKPMTAVEAKVVSGSFVPQFSIESLPGMGELTPEAADGLVRKYSEAGWKSLVPLAIGAGFLILWLKNKK